ncbi:MAG: DNA-binding protein [Herminiimonas sp.]|nr:DNA-binding protein [Herminiimonas sp.]MDB5853511.1 DNA-binding protein [Herminiimonas sp.]
MDTYSELQRRIKALQQQAEQVRRNEVGSVVADIEAKLQEFGITVDDLAGARPPKQKKTARATAPAKYRNPGTGETWSGRGREQMTSGKAPSIQVELISPEFIAARPHRY